MRARLIVFAYTLRDDVYRPAISRECGVDPINSDEFGDLRHYRNAIIRNRGILDVDTATLTVFSRGDIIGPTADQLREVFSQLIAGLNGVGIRYYGEDPGFEWGRRLNA
ncbi:MAG: hypothetical protein OXI01_06345 [Albidovulum sp.]|nr:hypothetical protein [Albidovulum sp.]